MFKPMLRFGWLFLAAAVLPCRGSAPAFAAQAGSAPTQPQAVNLWTPLQDSQGEQKDWMVTTPVSGEYKDTGVPPDSYHIKSLAEGKFSLDFSVRNPSGNRLQRERVQVVTALGYDAAKDDGNPIVIEVLRSKDRSAPIGDKVTIRYPDGTVTSFDHIVADPSLPARSEVKSIERGKPIGSVAYDLPETPGWDAPHLHFTVEPPGLKGAPESAKYVPKLDGKPIQDFKEGEWAGEKRRIVEASLQNAAVAPFKHKPTRGESLFRWIAQKAMGAGRPADDVKREEFKARVKHVELLQQADKELVSGDMARAQKDLKSAGRFLMLASGMEETAGQLRAREIMEGYEASKVVIEGTTKSMKQATTALVPGTPAHKAASLFNSAVQMAFAYVDDAIEKGADEALRNAKIRMGVEALIEAVPIKALGGKTLAEALKEGRRGAVSAFLKTLADDAHLRGAMLILTSKVTAAGARLAEDSVKDWAKGQIGALLEASMDRQREETRRGGAVSASILRQQVTAITLGGSSHIGSAAYFIGNSPVVDTVRESNFTVARVATVRETSQFTNGTILQAPVDVVLRWGAAPSDLDSHLTGPMADNSALRFHTYFGARGSLGALPNAQLYRDDTTAFGPEQTRINVVQPGVYRFYVHDFTNKALTNSTALSNSGAAVSLHVSGSFSLPEGDNLGQEVARIAVPANRVGTAWQAFELDSRTGILNRTEEIRNIDNPEAVPFNQ